MIEPIEKRIEQASGTHMDMVSLNMREAELYRGAGWAIAAFNPKLPDTDQAEIVGISYLTELLDANVDDAQAMADKALKSAMDWCAKAKEKGLHPVFGMFSGYVFCNLQEVTGTSLATIARRIGDMATETKRRQNRRKKHDTKSINRN